jgi:hypothetical protein
LCGIRHLLDPSLGYRLVGDINNVLRLANLQLERG